MSTPNVQVSSGWTDAVKFIVPPGSPVVFVIDREAPQGNLLPALARLCVRLAVKRAASTAGQKSEVTEIGSRSE